MPSAPFFYPPMLEILMISTFEIYHPGRPLLSPSPSPQGRGVPHTCGWLLSTKVVVTNLEYG